MVDGYSRKSHPLYGTWSNMRDRCNNKNNKDYRFYGARGIKVCERWDSFECFVSDMKLLGDKPKGFTMDRVDSEKGYCIENVRWASKSKQARNQRVRNTNTTGVVGVNKASGGYIARITHNGERIYIGYFKKFDDAVKARSLKEIEFGWHDVN